MAKIGGAYGPLRGTTAGGVAKAFRGPTGFKESQALQAKLTRPTKTLKITKGDAFVAGAGVGIVATEQVGKPGKESKETKKETKKESKKESKEEPKKDRTRKLHGGLLLGGKPKLVTKGWR